MENQTIEKIDFNAEPLDAEYSMCRFVGCDFSSIRVADVNFEECQFVGCNFSLTKFCAVLADIVFLECKMTGGDFTEVNKFRLSVSFEKCLLSYASFVEAKIKGTIFKECDLSGAYFDGAVLADAVFDKCDLLSTSFHKADLRRANFVSARNFTINPNECQVKRAVFAETDLRGLLAHLDIEIV